MPMANTRRACVFTTGSNEDNAAPAHAAGADEIILYSKEGFAEKVKQLPAGRGLPVIYDSVGKTTFEQSLQCLRPRGLLVLFGGASGAVPPFDLIRLSTMGSLYVTRPTLKDYIATEPELRTRAKDVFDAVAN